MSFAPARPPQVVIARSCPGSDQQENFGVGGRVEFKPALFPVPLRATLSYDKFRGGSTTTLKATSLMIDAVLRPLPAVKGVRPDLLGGVGIATVSPSGAQVVEAGVLRVIGIQVLVTAWLRLSFPHR